MQVSIVGFGIARRPLSKRLLLGASELRLQRFGDGGRDFGFDAEDVFEFAIVTLCPQMFAGRGANELRVNVHLVASLLHTAFEDVCHRKLTRNFRQAGRPQPEARCGSIW